MISPLLEGHVRRLMSRHCTAIKVSDWRTQMRGYVAARSGYSTSRASLRLNGAVSSST